MARTRAHEPLRVFLNGRKVGVLSKGPSAGVTFQYDIDWLSWAHAFPISLSLPLREDRYVGAMVSAVFDNLLPDMTQIRRQLAERTGADGTDFFSLLTVIGRDCVGALQFLPDDTSPGRVGEVQGDDVADKEIANMLRTLNEAPLGIKTEAAFRISIAGAQHKTALLRSGRQWKIPAGATATSHILKPQIGLRRDGIDLSTSVENEHFCMRLLSRLGIPTAITEILDFEDQRVLCVERFDRIWTSDERLLRVPQEDCCQALSVPPTRKYQSEGGPGLVQLLELMKASDQPDEDQRTLLRGQFMFWLLGATDGHAKNFSVFLHPGGGFSLSPLYDVMSAQPLFDAKKIRQNQFKLAMSLGSNRHYTVTKILPRHFGQTARAAGVSKKMAEAVMTELLQELPHALEQVQHDLPADFPESLQESIARGVQSRVDLVLRS